MPHVLRRSDQLRQHEGLSTQEALKLEDAASGRLEEQVVIEEAGVDRLRKEEGVGLHVVAVGIDHGDAFGVEHPEPRVGVVHLHAGLAADIAVDDESVSRRAGPAQKRVDGKRRARRSDEGEVSLSDRVGDLELIAHLPILHGDQPGILEPLEIDERAVLLGVRVGGGQHRAALLVAEQILAPGARRVEIAGKLRLEHAALLIDEQIVGVELHEAGDVAAIVDRGRAGIDADGEERVRGDLAAVDDGRAGRARGQNAGIAAGDRTCILDQIGAASAQRIGSDADAELALAVHLAAVLDDDVAAGADGARGDGDAVADIRHDRDGAVARAAAGGDLAAVDDVDAAIGAVARRGDAGEGRGDLARVLDVDRAVVAAGESQDADGRIDLAAVHHEDRAVVAEA